MIGCAAQLVGWVANSYTKTLSTGCLQKLQLGVSSRFYSVTPFLTHMHPAQHVDWLTITMIMITIITIIIIIIIKVINDSNNNDTNDIIVIIIMIIMILMK